MWRIPGKSGESNGSEYRREQAEVRVTSEAASEGPERAEPEQFSSEEVSVSQRAEAGELRLIHSSLFT